MAASEPFQSQNASDPSVIDADFVEPEVINAELVDPQHEITGDTASFRQDGSVNKGMAGRRAFVAPQPQRRVRVPSWRFWLPMLLQLGLILPVPLRNAYVAVAGETIVLETMAVDPYDIFRGYSQTLAYTISDADVFEQLPGYEIVERLERQPQDAWDENEIEAFFVILEAPKTPSDAEAEKVAETNIEVTSAGETSAGETSAGETSAGETSAGETSAKAEEAKAEETSPPLWTPVGIVRDRPESLPDNQVVLHATHNGNAILYNLERYYMPEDQRERINQTVQELQSSEIGSVRMEAKVDRFGKAIPVALWLGARRYQF